MSKNTIISTRYSLTNHAIDRVRVRFGYGAQDAVNWINELMKEAKYVTEGHNGSLIYESDCGVRMYVNGVNNSIITVHSEISTAFMNPVLDREARRLKRQFTKDVREVELELAMIDKRYADMSMNFARARNPETRELIEGRMVKVSNERTRKALSIGVMKSKNESKIRAIDMMIEK